MHTVMSYREGLVINQGQAAVENCMLVPCMFKAK